MGAYFFEAVWKFFDLNRRPPITHEALNLISSDNRIPIERARKELNFEPKISYAEGIQEIKVYLDKK
jgi:nucleoside-diphosphate-sugar epimerase